MKIRFQIRGLNAGVGLRAWLARQLERFHQLIPVSTAEVVLERGRDSAPAFRAQVHLAVPGPDIHADARDHTLEAAWLKVAKKLRRQIERRKFHQLLRHKIHGQPPRTANSRPGAPAWRGRGSKARFSGALCLLAALLLLSPSVVQAQPNPNPSPPAPHQPTNPFPCRTAP